MTVDPSDLRASDADREAAADVLRAQCAAGRLDRDRPTTRRRRARRAADALFEIRERPAWVPLVCIVGFPIGLIALAYKDTQRIVVSFDEPEHGRTRITSAGLARRPVRRAFAGLGA